MNLHSDKSYAEHRDQSIKKAVLTSILSKVGTLLLRIISIPVAINVLGMELFGVYATILVAVEMIDLFYVGIGPALTQKLSKAQLENNLLKEAQLFSTSFLLSLAFTLVVVAIFGGLLWTVPITDLFGAKYAPFAESMQRASLIGLFIIGVEVVCMVAEKARDGYMETRYSNSWGAAGNVLGAILLLVGVIKFPTIEFLVIAINGSVVAAKLGNTIHMLIQRPYLIPSLKTFSAPLVKTLMSGAVIFTIVYAMSAAVEYNGIGYLIGRFLGPEQIANYTILVTLHVSFTGLIQMFTIPMWPAVIDAYERKEYQWVRKGARKLRVTGVCFGLFVAGGCALVGTWAVRLWVGDEFSLNQIALALFGLYFALHLWRHVNQILCLGVGQEKSVAMIVVAESCCVFLSTWLLLKNGNEIAHILGAICVCLLCFSGWMFPRVFSSAFRNKKAAPGIDFPKETIDGESQSDRETITPRC